MLFYNHKNKRKKSSQVPEKNYIRIIGSKTYPNKAIRYQ